MRKDLYQVLGLRPDCSYEEIKTAYRKLALKFHPDVNGNDKYFEERFKEVKDAYELLSHQETRSQYDLKNKFNRKAQQTGSHSGNEYSTPPTLADYVESISRKIKLQETNHVNKAQLIMFFDQVLKQSLLTQLIKIGDAQSNERIVEAIIPLLRFLSNSEIDKYEIPLARLAGSNNDLVAKIHSRVQELKRSYRAEDLVLLFKVALALIVGVVFIIGYSNDMADDQEQAAQPSRPQLQAPAYQPIKPASRFKGNQLKTGDSPYNNYFGDGVYNRAYMNQLEIKNGQDLDAIVCLTNYHSRKTIRNEYVRADETFVLTSIPSGTYFLKTFYGKDWNPDTVFFEGRLRGSFDTSFSFSKSEDFTDLIKMEQTADGYSIYTVTLYRVPGGNMESQDITSSEFFAGVP